ASTARGRGPTGCSSTPRAGCSPASPSGAASRAPGPTAGSRCSPTATGASATTHSDRDPVQPPSSWVLRAVGGWREAPDAGGRGVHAQAGDGLLRGAQEPCSFRSGVGLKKAPCQHAIWFGVFPPVVPRASMLTRLPVGPTWSVVPEQTLPVL